MGEDKKAEKVLVVDDIAANRALIEATLEDAGYRLQSASSGMEALEAFERDRPDCVLLDIRMPEMDGFEVARRMRAMPGGTAAPILFVTALRDVDAFDEAMRAGGFDFLTKPVRPTELLTRVEAALALKRASAERDELVALLRRQRDELMRSVLVNERVAAFLVHDLKNPVAGMQMAAELIHTSEACPERFRDIAGRIHAQAIELNRMILGLLDLNRADEGKLRLSRVAVDPTAMATDIVEAQRMRAEARRITIDVAVGVEQLRVDQNLFRRALENLLDNALRYAPSGTRVDIAAARVDGAVEVTVADAGPGVPAAMSEHIFDRFVQATPAAKEGHGNARTGRGLGLAFCKTVVEAHGGTIRVEDANPGARFVTRWPDGE